MSESSKPSKKNRRSSGGRKHLIILFFVLLLLAAGYYYLRIYSHEAPPQANIHTMDVDYTELENNSPDQYISIVVYNTETDLLYISKSFYKSDLFWPYIFLANKPNINNPLFIPRDVIIKIPKLTASELNIEDPANVKRVSVMADSILNDANKIHEPEEDFTIY